MAMQMVKSWGARLQDFPLPVKNLNRTSFPASSDVSYHLIVIIDSNISSGAAVTADEKKIFLPSIEISKQP